MSFRKANIISFNGMSSKMRLVTLTVSACLNIKILMLDLTQFFLSSQVNEIYHDNSLGARINVVLVRIVLVDAKKVRIIHLLTSCIRYQMTS